MNRHDCIEFLIYHPEQLSGFILKNGKGESLKALDRALATVPLNGAKGPAKSTGPRLVITKNCRDFIDILVSRRTTSCFISIPSQPPHLPRTFLRLAGKSRPQWLIIIATTNSPGRTGNAGNTKRTTFARSGCEWPPPTLDPDGMSETLIVKPRATTFTTGNRNKKRRRTNKHTLEGPRSCLNTLHHCLTIHHLHVHSYKDASTPTKTLTSTSITPPTFTLQTDKIKWNHASPLTPAQASRRYHQALPASDRAAGPLSLLIAHCKELLRLTAHN